MVPEDTHVRKKRQRGSGPDGLVTRRSERRKLSQYPQRGHPASFFPGSRAIQPFRIRSFRRARTGNLVRALRRPRRGIRRTLHARREASESVFSGHRLGHQGVGRLGPPPSGVAQLLEIKRCGREDSCVTGIWRSEADASPRSCQIAGPRRGRVHRRSSPRRDTRCAH